MTHTADIIPPLDTATDPIRCDEDMRQRWRALLGPLGFDERLLWLGFVGPDRRMVKTLSQVPVGASPQHDLVEQVMIGLEVLLEDFDAGTSIALLLTRPGKDPVSAEDRRWAQTLMSAASRIGVPLEPIFRANDAGVVAL